MSDLIWTGSLNDAYAIGGRVGLPEERRAEVLAAVKKLGAEQHRLVTDDEFRALVG